MTGAVADPRGNKLDSRTLTVQQCVGAHVRCARNPRRCQVLLTDRPECARARRASLDGYPLPGPSSGKRPRRARRTRMSGRSAPDRVVRVVGREDASAPQKIKMACKKSRCRQPPTPVRERVANPQQGDFAKPDWEMRRASGDSPEGSTRHQKKGSGLSRADRGAGGAGFAFVSLKILVTLQVTMRSTSSS